MQVVGLERCKRCLCCALFPWVLGRGSGSKPLAKPGTCLPFWLHSSPAARSPCSWGPAFSSQSCHPWSCSPTLQEQRSGNPTRTRGFPVPWLRGGFGAWLCCRGKGKGWGGTMVVGLAGSTLPSLSGQTHSTAIPPPRRGSPGRCRGRRSGGTATSQSTGHPCAGAAAVG